MQGEQTTISETEPAQQEVVEMKKHEAPMGTFDSLSFEQLMAHYNYSAGRLPPTLELTQNFLMTNNMGEAASLMS